MKIRPLVLRAAMLVALVGGAIIAGAMFQDGLNPSALEATMSRLGGWASITFVASFALATVMFVPGSLFGLAGGALFGPLWGMILNLLGGTLGATVAFLVARYTGADWVAAKTGGRLKQIVAGAEAEGWRFVALTRLVPIVPFNVLNYALGLTRIRLSHYTLATLVCMVPGAAAYAWLGHAGREALEGNSAGLRYGLLGLAVLALVAFLPRFVRRVKESPGGWISVPELRHRLAERAPPAVLDVREPEEFTGPLGHIPNAINMPMSELARRLDEVITPDCPSIVLVCRTDKRSEKAAAILRSNGVQHVMVMRGGMEEWTRQAAPSHPPATPIGE